MQPGMALPRNSCQSLADELARRMGPALRAFFRKRTADAHEAEDLTQEVFYRLSSRADEIELRNPEGYVFQIAANLLRDRARRNGVETAARRELAASAEGKFEEVSPERVLLGKARLREVHRALAELPERTRAVFVLQRFEEFTYKEIAGHLGISTSLVEKLMMDAMKHLAARLGGER